MAKNAGLVDFRSISVSIEGEATAAAGLKRRRKELELLVEPLLSDSPTDFVVGFRGKRRYLNYAHIPPGGMHAVLALQFLYGIERAVRAGDVDEIILQSIGFADANCEVRNYQYWGVGADHASAAIARRRRTASDNAKLKRTFDTPEKQQQACDIIARIYNPKHGVSLSAACDRAVPLVRAQMNVETSAKTLVRTWSKLHSDKA